MDTPQPIRVRIIQLGKRVYTFTSDEPTTLHVALAAAGVERDALRTDVRVNGEPAGDDRVLLHGDVVTVVPPIRGGAAESSVASLQSSVECATLGVCRAETVVLSLASRT